MPVLKGLSEVNKGIRSNTIPHKKKKISTAINSFVHALRTGHNKVHRIRDLWA